MHCPEDWNLEALLRGRLSATELADRKEHVLHCDACRSRLDEIAENLRLADSLASLFELQEPNLPFSATAPEMIGEFRVIREIGRGGMGIVYEARQQDPARAVAIKVLHHGSRADSSRLKLFRREAQALARLKHANIAAIHATGETSDGQRYLVLELASGVPLDQYSSEHKLDTHARCQLVKMMSRAINYAHQRGVIHLDLKPSNVLIDPDGQPKILDFGLARIVDPDATYATITSDSSKLQGTLPYMSPEQLQADGDDVDSRSDVYSLGVILYELLTGRLPYNFSSMDPYSVIRTIHQESPTRPSRINPRLCGDLETIILMALAQEPPQRYQSPLALADDLDRLETNQPILARPPSSLYQLRKLVSRHKVPFAGAAVFIVTITAFSIWMSALYARTRAAEMLAMERVGQVEAAQKDSEKMKDFLSWTLSSPRPERAGRDVRVSEVLDDAVVELETRFKDNARIRAELGGVIAASYQTVGRMDDAAELLEQYIPILERELGERHLLTLNSKNNYALILRRKGRAADSEKMLRENAEILRRKFGEDHPDVLKAQYNRSSALIKLGRFEDAKQVLAKNLPLMRRVFGTSNVFTMGALNNLAIVSLSQGKLAEAESRFEENLAMKTESDGEENLRTLTAASNLALVYQARGRYAEAEALNRKTLAIKRRVLGDNARATLRSAAHLLDQLLTLGRYEEVEQRATETLRAATEEFGETHEVTLALRSTLAIVDLERGYPARAEQEVREILEVKLGVLDADHPSVLYSLGLIAETLIDQGRFVEAAKVCRDAIPRLVAVRGEHHPTTLEANVVLARALNDQGNRDEAALLCERALETQTRLLSPGHRNTVNTLQVMASVAAGQDKLNEAEQLYRRSLADTLASLGPDHPIRVNGLLGLADVLLRTRRPEEATGCVEEALRIQRDISGLNPVRIAASESRLGACLAARGMHAEAERMLLDSYETIRNAEGVAPGVLEETVQRIVHLYEDWNRAADARAFRSALPEIPER